jgi:hypothetical protein
MLIITPTIMLATTRKGAIKLRTKSRDLSLVMETTKLFRTATGYSGLG